MHPLKSFKLEVTVKVEYTCRGKRVVKTFIDMFAARRFYRAQFSKNCADPANQPKIIK